jgi:mutator protein MutT
MSETNKVIKVAAGVIVQDGRYLITQRFETSSFGGLWEFPGGKCHPDESLSDCLRRELDEELGIWVDVGEELKAVAYSYQDFTVKLHFYRCTILQGTPRPIASQAFRWVNPSELSDYAFPEANRAFVRELQDQA